MSAFDNCLFYRTTATETTYITVYVDDTFIFSNSAANIDAVIANVIKHYEVTLDRDATSFLGLSLTHNTDGTVDQILWLLYRSPEQKAANQPIGTSVT